MGIHRVQPLSCERSPLFNFKLGQQHGKAARNGQSGVPPCQSFGGASPREPHAASSAVCILGSFLCTWFILFDLFHLCIPSLYVLIIFVFSTSSVFVICVNLCQLVSTCVILCQLVSTCVNLCQLVSICISRDMDSLVQLHKMYTSEIHKVNGGNQKNCPALGGKAPRAWLVTKMIFRKPNNQ